MLRNLQINFFEQKLFRMYVNLFVTRLIVPKESGSAPVVVSFIYIQLACALNFQMQISNNFVYVKNTPFIPLKL
jgi:hypothetical protein